MLCLAGSRGWHRGQSWLPAAWQLGEAAPGTSRVRVPPGDERGGLAVPLCPAAWIASSSSSVGFTGVWVMWGLLDAELWVQGRAGRATNPFYILLETLYKPSCRAFPS